MSNTSFDSTVQNPSIKSAICQFSIFLNSLGGGRCDQYCNAMQWCPSWFQHCNHLTWIRWLLTFDWYLHAICIHLKPPCWEVWLSWQAGSHDSWLWWQVTHSQAAIVTFWRVSDHIWHSTEPDILRGNRRNMLCWVHILKWPISPTNAIYKFYLFFHRFTWSIGRKAVSPLLIGLTKGRPARGGLDGGQRAKRGKMGKRLQTAPPMHLKAEQRGKVWPTHQLSGGEAGSAEAKKVIDKATHTQLQNCTFWITPQIKAFQAMTGGISVAKIC